MGERKSTRRAHAHRAAVSECDDATDDNIVNGACVVYVCSKKHRTMFGVYYACLLQTGTIFTRRMTDPRAAASRGRSRVETPVTYTSVQLCNFSVTEVCSERSLIRAPPKTAKRIVCLVYDIFTKLSRKIHTGTSKRRNPAAHPTRLLNRRKTITVSRHTTHSKDLHIPHSPPSIRKNSYTTSCPQIAYC